MLRLAYSFTGLNEPSAIVAQQNLMYADVQ